MNKKLHALHWIRTGLMNPVTQSFARSGSTTLSHSTYRQHFSRQRHKSSPSQKSKTPFTLPGCYADYGFDSLASSVSCRQELKRISFLEVKRALEQPGMSYIELDKYVEAIERGYVNPRAKDEDGRSLLHMAIQGKIGLSVVERLVRAGCNILEADKNGCTPMAMALHMEDPQLLEILLSSGQIDLDVLDSKLEKAMGPCES